MGHDFQQGVSMCNDIHPSQNAIADDHCSVSHAQRCYYNTPFTTLNTCIILHVSIKIESITYMYWQWGPVIAAPKPVDILKKVNHIFSAKKPSIL